MSRSAQWVFTLNSYTEEDVGRLVRVQSPWVVIFGKEIAPTTNRPHLQGVIWRSDEVRVRRKQVEKVLGGHCWLDPTYDVESATGYSIKDGEFYTNWMEGEELLEARKLIEEAKKFGTEYSWLGNVFDNGIGRWLDHIEQLPPAYKMFKWQEGLDKKK